MNRQKLALFILLIVLVLAVLWSYLSVPQQKTVTTLKYAPGHSKPTVQGTGATPATPHSAAVTATAAIADERTLRLDLLEREQSGFKGYRRNIFKPIFSDEIKIMRQRAVAVKPLTIPPVSVLPQKYEPPVVDVPPVTLQSTLARFIFLGYVKKDKHRTIFLSKDNEIILVRKGDVFAGRYEATSVTDQALTIRSIDSGEEIVIPLNENRPLAAAN